MAIRSSWGIVLAKYEVCYVCGPLNRSGYEQFDGLQEERACLCVQLF